MPGFMSGFGQAFADSFKQSRQNSANAERDDVRMAFESKMQNRKYGYELAQQEAKDIRRAKTVAKATQGNEDGWQEFFNMRDLSDEQLMKWGKENQITVVKGDPVLKSTSTTDDTEAATDLSNSAQTSVNTQMTESGMAPKESGGLFDSNTWGAKGKANREKRINDKVDTILGPDKGQETRDANEKALAGSPGFKVSITPRKSLVDEDEMYKANNSIEAGNWVLRAQEYANQTGDTGPLVKAKEMYDSVMMHEELKASRDKDAKFGPVVSAAVVGPDGSSQFTREKGPNGEWLLNGKPIPEGMEVIPVDSAAKEQITNILNKTRPEVTAHQQKVTAYNSLLTDGKAITEYLKIAPDAMTYGGEVSARVKEFVSNLNGTISVFTQRPDTVNKDTLTELMNNIEDVESSLKTRQWDEIEKNGMVFRLIEARKNLLAYSLAAADGNTGRNLSNQDFEKYYSLVDGHGDKNVWQRTFQDLVLKAEEGLNLGAQALNEGPDAAAFYEFNRYKLPIKLGDDADSSRTKNKEANNNRDMIFNTKFENALPRNEQAQPQFEEGKTYYKGGKPFVWKDGQMWEEVPE